MNVALLITLTDDGKDGATACLEECQRQTEALTATGGYSFTTFLNDEGVGGYQKVWEKVLGIGFDFYLWMDSDLRLEEGAFASFFENSFFLRHKAVIAGTVSDLSGNLLSGGRSRHGRLLEPDPVIPVPCHLYDMTLTLVPEYAVRHLENPLIYSGPIFFTMVVELRWRKPESPESSLRGFWRAPAGNRIFLLGRILTDRPRKEYRH